MAGQGFLKHYQHTFSNGSVFALDDADDNDGNDDDSQSGHHGDNEIDIGHKSHQLRLEVTEASGSPGGNVVIDLSCWGQGA